MSGVITLKSVIAWLSGDNKSAVNIYLASVINNCNNSSH